MKQYNEEILKLENIKIDTTYSKDGTVYVGRSDNFYVVPTEMVINGDRDLWKGCPPLVNFEILECIEEVIASNQYPYNTSVGQLFCDKHNLGKYDDTGTFLSAMVYETQCYRSSIEDEIKAKEFHNKMIEDGFYKSTPELLKEVAGTKRKFLVVVDTQNIFGGEGKKVKENKLLLKDWGENGGLHWMNPRATRTGYKAKIGQYIKEAI